MFNKKKRYFKKRLEAITKMIWDNEFKREKTLMIREEVRQTYDNTCSRLNIMEERIKGFPDKKEDWDDEQKRVDDEIIRLTQDKERYQSQLNKMDIDVKGCLPSNECPDGFEGLDQMLASLRELYQMTKEYIRKM